MNTEEQLINGDFTSIEDQLRVNLLYSSYWLRDKISAFLKPYGITPQQLDVLRILQRQEPEPISTKEIREQMMVSGADSSRLVDRLCDKDLIWKRPCQHDGRLVQVFIDKKGKALLSKIDKNLAELDSAMGNLSSKELKVLNQLLNKMRFQK